MTSRSPDLGMEVELPETWTRPDESFPPEVIAVFTDGRSLDPAFDTSVVLTLADADDLDAWQAEVRAARLATLPDVQILDDRAVEETPEVHCAALMTMGGTGSTILVRSWVRIADGHGLTLTVTTLPHIDAAHAQTLDAIGRTWSLQQSAIPLIGDIFTGVMAGIDRWNDDEGKGYSGLERLGRAVFDGGLNFGGSFVGGLIGSAAGVGVAGLFGAGAGAAAGAPAAGVGAIPGAVGGGSVGAVVGSVVGDVVGGYVGATFTDSLADTILD